VVRGRFENIKVTADTIEAEGVELSRVEVTLEDVSFPVSKVLSGRATRVKVSSGRGSARISAPAFDRALAQILPEGAAVIPNRTGTIPIQGNALDLGVTQLSLPTPIEGMQYESAEFVGTALELKFSLERTSLEI
jgi:hypothetical protein